MGAPSRSSRSPGVRIQVRILVLIVLAVLLAVLVALTLPGPRSKTPPSPVGSTDLNPTLAIRGEALFRAAGSCVTCHGERGAGIRDATGRLLATPLDESGHAWHHTDEALSQSILNGLPGGMPAWRERGLTEEDARALVEYIKSLWRAEIREECQGPKHMSASCARVLRG